MLHVRGNGGLIAVTCLLAVSSAIAIAQGKTARKAPPAASSIKTLKGSDVMATVEGQPITRRELTYFWLQADGLSQEKTKLEAQLAKNAPLVKQIEEYQKQYNEVSPRLKTLEDAQLVSNRWGRIMTHIAHQTPSPTWLTAMRVTSNEPSKPIGLSLVGVAPGQAPISEFILRLQNSKDLENVTLKYSQEKMMQLTKMVEFEVTADIVDTAEAKPKQEGESK